MPRAASWEQVYEGQGNQFSAVVTLAALTLRVQAVNGTIKGPFRRMRKSANGRGRAIRACRPRPICAA